MSWMTDLVNFFGGNSARTDNMQNGGSGSMVWSALGRGWNDVSGVTAQNQFNAAEAQKARDFNSAEAEKQRSWETMMSNTAYQRQFADMQAAGINPVAAAMGGNMSGASTPSGAAASGPAAHGAGPGNGGFAGLAMSIIGKAASVAIAKGLEAKFTNSAMKAADNHELVTAKVRNLAAQEQLNSARMSWLNRKMKDGLQKTGSTLPVADEDLSPGKQSELAALVDALYR